MSFFIKNKSTKNTDSWAVNNNPVSLDGTKTIIGSELHELKLRDAEVQNEPYVYSIGQHGNEALALRYGIVNRKQSSSLPSSKIKIQKIEKIGDDKYKVKLVDFGNKDAVVIHEPGTDYIKTFYPLNEEWFTEHNDLETALKNTGSFTLKELAKFHIDTLITTKSRS
jgi:hypothetical protein